jgi:hypothetical protein
MNLPVSLMTGAMCLMVLFGGFGFYALRVTFGRGTPAGGRFGEMMANREQINQARQAADRRSPRNRPGEEIAEPNSVGAPNPAAAPPSSPASPATAPPGVAGGPMNFPPGFLRRPPNFPNNQPPGFPAFPNGATPPTNPNGASAPARPVSPAQPVAPAVSPAVPKKATKKSEMLGGPEGFPFEMDSPGQQPIVGFRFAMGSWAGTAAVAQLEPIVDRNVTGEPENLIVGRDGFVVGGLQVDAAELVQAVRIVFVRQQEDGTLDKKDFYLSDCIGKPTGQTAKTLGKGNVPVLGLYGRRGLVLNALGLLLAE